MKESIYLDNASTTYPKPEAVYQAMEKAGRNLAVNAGRGFYGLAREAFQLIEDTREQICRMVHGESVAEAVFTPSATIACNQVLGGLDWKREAVVYVTPFEHNAIMRVLASLQKQYGFEVEELALNRETMTLDTERIRYQFLRKHPTVLVMNHVSNVTGTVIPWQEIGKLAESYHPAVVIDGSQALGLVPVRLQNTAADFYIFAGHKTLYGPLGIGGYVNNHGRRLKPILFGGTGSDSLNLEMDTANVKGYEPGSMNIAAIAGLYAALMECGKASEGEWLEKEQNQREYLVKMLARIPEVILYPPLSGAVAGILSFNLRGFSAGDVGALLDQEYHIAVRTGYHCAPLIHKYLNDEGTGGTVRVSIGRFTKESELERLAEAVEEIAEG
ncbi:aminotransferase class V-fold PLP-dependent enzyme [Petralouisia muris]|uniref:Aminotransferase class V-fold PLP-dependent enzyme n=1 Tax=Petralouisia muris TaxID=3032872 RepID=A0AC61RSE4_9FIRM|nr:aminotransferase class V-fold PLP-dependent enzyme [Petralouisia muris]TGY91524.1 aminotransferase class V-fold PLP-dependent enzyme [Petralouisia muris]